MLKEILRKYRASYLGATTFNILAAIFMTLFSLQLGIVVDSAQKAHSNLLGQFFICLFCTCAWSLCSLLAIWFKNNHNKQVLEEVKTRLFHSFYDKDLHDKASKQENSYLNTTTKNMDIYQENYLTPRCDIVAAFSSVFISTLAIFWIEWRMALGFILISFLTMAASQIPGILMRKATANFTQKSNHFLKQVTNFLEGFEQIKLLQIQKRVVEHLSSSNSDFEQARKSYNAAKEGAVTLMMFFSFLSQIFCMSLGIWFVSQGSLTIGALIASVQLLNFVFTPLQLFINNKNLMSTVKDIENDFDAKLAKKEAEPAQNLTETIERIDFEHLGLELGDKALFQDFSYQFAKDKHYAIIGESGRGKSTLMKLLLNYFDKKDYAGQIMVNGQSVSQLASDSLYQKIAFIQKNDFFIEGSVADNIALYRDINAPDQTSLYQSLHFNEAFLSKKLDLERQEVSYGEKQRIDLARFLVKDYDVLIFDEPTSNLDPNLAAEVMDYILSIKDRIVIVITHNQGRALLDRFDDCLEL